jgi:hypothetical protein
MDYEPGLCDLVRAIDLTLIAPVEPEADARIVQLLLKTRSEWRWYADCERLIEKVGSLASVSGWAACPSMAEVPPIATGNSRRCWLS